MGRTPAARTFAIIFRLSLLMPFWVGLFQHAEAQNVQVEPGEVNRVVDDWIKIAQAECDRNFYDQAQDSLDRIRHYSSYLSRQQQEEVDELQQRIEQASVERTRLLENIEKAGGLIKDSEFLRAQTYLREAVKSDMLNEEEKNRVKLTLQRVEAKVKEQKQFMADLFKQSRKDYKHGDFEKAREGFSIVASSGLYVPRTGKTAEDYLALIEQGQGKKKVKQKKKQSAPKAVDEQEARTGSTPMNTVPPAERQPAQTPQTGQLPVYGGQSELFGNQPQQNPTSRENIKQEYIRAVVRDAETKATKYVGKAEFSFARAVAQNASDVLQKYRPDIGEQLYIQYSERLQKLSDMIDDQQRRWEFRWDTKGSGL